MRQRGVSLGVSDVYIPQTPRVCHWLTVSRVHNSTARTSRHQITHKTLLSQTLRPSLPAQSYIQRRALQAVVFILFFLFFFLIFAERGGALFLHIESCVQLRKSRNKRENEDSIKKYQETRETVSPVVRCGEISLRVLTCRRVCNVSEYKHPFGFLCIQKMLSALSRGGLI